jgi:hypothetical protein
MQVEIGEFINKLRDRLALKLDDDKSIDIMAAFDRSCVQVLVEEHQGQKELTSGQKAARTRARNRQTRQAMTGSSAVHPLTNSVDREAGNG